MKQVLLLLSVTLMVFGYSKRAFATAPDWKRIYRERVGAVVHLYSKGGLCSGALIRETWVLTAWHCVGSQRKVYVAGLAQPSKYQLAQTIASDPENDLALLELPHAIPGAKTFPLFPEKEALAEGEPIATIGHPMSGGLTESGLREGHHYILSAGVVSRVGSSRIVTDMAVNPGSSGGPVFDAEGRLLGVVSAKLTGSFVDNIGYLIPHQKIYAMIHGADAEKKNPHLQQTIVPDTSVNFDLQWFNDRYLVKHYHSIPSGFALELGANLYDRLHLAFAHRFPSDPSVVKGVQVICVGPIFQIDTKPYLPLRITPHYGRIVYQANRDSQSFEQVGIKARYLGLDFGYETQLRKKEFNWAVTIGITLLGTP